MNLVGLLFFLILALSGCAPTAEIQYPVAPNLGAFRPQVDRQSITDIIQYEADLATCRADAARTEDLESGEGMNFWTAGIAGERMGKWYQMKQQERLVTRCLASRGYTLLEE